MVAKKTVARKKTVVKAVKKIAHKRSTPTRIVAMKSFRLYKDVKPFTSMKLTRQTLYWAILLAFVAITQLWILKIQMDIVNVTTLILNQ